MSSNVYQFNEYHNLSPGALFLLIALDQTKEQLGFKDLAAAATFLLSVPDIPAAGKNIEATPGTSVISIFLRKVISKRASPGTRYRTLTLQSFSLIPFRVRWIYTTHLAAVVGRMVPVLDFVVFGYDATLIMYRTMKRYNEIVKPEDRLGE